MMFFPRAVGLTLSGILVMQNFGKLFAISIVLCGSLKLNLSLIIILNSLDEAEGNSKTNARVNQRTSLEFLLKFCVIENFTELL